MICGLSVVNSIPTHVKFGVWAGSTKHCCAITSQALLATPYMPIFLMIPTADLCWLRPPLALCFADQSILCCIEIHISDGSLRELCAELQNSILELLIELDSHIVLPLNTPILIKISRLRLCDIHYCYWQATNWSSIMHPK